MWNFLRKKKKKKLPQKPVTDTLLNGYIDTTATIVSGQMRGNFNTKAREENRETLIWALTNTFNHGVRYGKEEARREVD